MSSRGLLATVQRWWTGRRETRTFLRRVRSVPATTLDALPDDTVGRVTGRAWPLDDRTLEAPLSGRRCVFFRVSVIASGGPLYGYESEEIVTEQCACPFVLDDGRARAVVVPALDSLVCRFDVHSRSSAAFDASPTQRALLVRHGKIDRDWFGTSHLVYREAVIALGETVTVCGAGMREPDPDGMTGETDYRTGFALRLRFTSSPRVPLLVTDLASAR